MMVVKMVMKRQIGHQWAVSEIESRISKAFLSFNCSIADLFNLFKNATIKVPRCPFPYMIAQTKKKVTLKLFKTEENH